MENKRIRMLIDFEVNEDELAKHNLTAQDVLNHITLEADEVADGFLLSTDLPGLDRTADFFLHNARVVTQELAHYPTVGDHLDQFRDLACEEILRNGTSSYGMDPAELQSCLEDSVLIDGMAQQIKSCYDGDVREAVDTAFRASFHWMLASHRLHALNLDGAYLDAANQSIYLGDNRIFLSKDYQLCCQLDGEEDIRPLRRRIQEVEEGDAFFQRNSGRLCTTSSDASKNLTEEGDIWVVYGDDGDYYFEADIDADLARRLEFALEKIYPHPEAELNPEKEPHMTVLKVEPGKTPYAKDIDPGLESLQHEVSGYIEVVYPFTDPVGIICNEEAKLMGMELNRALRDDDGDIYDIIAGPFMVVGLGEDDFVSLTNEQLEKYAQHFQSPEMFFQMNGKIVAIPIDPIPEHLPEHEQSEKSAVTMDTSGLAIDTLVGTWHTIDHAEVDGHTFYLMEHDTYGDETSCVIVDERGRLSLTDIYNGFDEHTIDLLHQELLPVDKMPDESISIDEMKAYGYGWGGMLPLREEKATELIDDHTVYALYKDHTEGMVIDLNELKEHAARGGIFGVEKVEWNAKQNAQNLDSVLENAKDRAANNTNPTIKRDDPDRII